MTLLLGWLPEVWRKWWPRLSVAEMSEAPWLFYGVGQDSSRSLWHMPET